MTEEVANAEVVAVYPNKVRVAVDDLLNFQAAGSLFVLGLFSKSRTMTTFWSASSKAFQSR